MEVLKAQCYILLKELTINFLIPLYFPNQNYFLVINFLMDNNGLDFD